jgi:hypothetical protein
LVLGGRLCKENGRIALVLPNSILSRDSWLYIRKGIAKSYAIEYIIVSFARGVPNFSSDTQFREILLVLKKRKKGTAKILTEVVSMFEAVDGMKLHEIDALAYGIKAKKTNIVLAGRSQPVVASTKSFNWDRVENLVDNWYRLVAFQNLELTEHHLKIVEKLCTPLKTFFTLGSVVDHSNGFEVIKNRPASDYFAAVWGSGEKTGFNVLKASPEHFVIVTDKSIVKCKLWEKKYSSTLMILRRGQLDTQYALMFELDVKAISNVWWPLIPSKKLNDLYIKAVVIFVNSTLGIIHMLGERLETRGLWMEFKKGHLTKLPIPDFRKIEKGKLDQILTENQMDEAFSGSLPSIRDYITAMAEIEKNTSNYNETIEKALENPALKYRAALDKVSFELLNLLGCEKIPQGVYGLVSNELEVLRNVMEAAPENHTIRDRGASALRGIYDKYQKKLGEFNT